MRRLLPALATLPFALWGCNGPELPAEYRRLSVPTARLSSEQATRAGRELFARHCAICHGERGDGRGIRRNLSTRPQDFTDPAWRRRSPPRRVYYLIREGRQGTAMAGWKTLDADQVWDLVAYLRSLATPATRGQASEVSSPREEPAPSAGWRSDRGQGTPDR